MGVIWHYHIIWVDVSKHRQMTAEETTAKVCSVADLGTAMSHVLGLTDDHGALNYTHPVLVTPRRALYHGTDET